MGQPKIAARGLCRRFPARHEGEPEVVALAGVDLEAGDGEFVSIVGPSGCGKSTLFNILAGLDSPTGGTVELDGQPASRLLGAIGYMPQKDLLMPWRTVIANTTVGLEVAGVRRGEARARARELFARFGLEGFEDSWPTALSGGMRQRAALLRTFLAGRQVMLLDEPFGALDALTRQEMQAWLLDIWGESRKTILFVTHDVEEAIFLSDRVYLMSSRPGRIELCLDIDLERPRTLATTLSEPFIEFKERLLEPLHRVKPGKVA